MSNKKAQSQPTNNKSTIQGLAIAAGLVEEAKKLGFTDNTSQAPQATQATQATQAPDPINEERGIIDRFDPANMPSASDLVGGYNFYPDAPRVKFTDLRDKQIVLVDGYYIAEMETELGTHDAFLIAFMNVAEVQTFGFSKSTIMSTISSGQAIIDQMARLKENANFPCLATPHLIESKVKGHNPYWSLA